MRAVFQGSPADLPDLTYTDTAGTVRGGYTVVASPADPLVLVVCSSPEKISALRADERFSYVEEFPDPVEVPD
jgi:hypothetical protein